MTAAATAVCPGDCLPFPRNKARPSAATFPRRRHACLPRAPRARSPHRGRSRAALARGRGGRGRKEGRPRGGARLPILVRPHSHSALLHLTATLQMRKAFARRARSIPRHLPPLPAVRRGKWCCLREGRDSLPLPHRVINALVRQPAAQRQPIQWPRVWARSTGSAGRALPDLFGPMVLLDGPRDALLVLWVERPPWPRGRPLRLRRGRGEAGEAPLPGRRGGASGRVHPRPRQRPAPPSSGSTRRVGESKLPGVPRGVWRSRAVKALLDEAGRSTGPFEDLFPGKGALTESGPSRLKKRLERGQQNQTDHTHSWKVPQHQSLLSQRARKAAGLCHFNDFQFPCLDKDSQKSIHSKSILSFKFNHNRKNDDKVRPLLTLPLYSFLWLDGNRVPHFSRGNASNPEPPAALPCHAVPHRATATALHAFDCIDSGGGMPGLPGVPSSAPPPRATFGRRRSTSPRALHVLLRCAPSDTAYLLVENFRTLFAICVNFRSA